MSMQKLTKYQTELSKLVERWGEDAVLVFRGQRDSEWPLNSSAERRLQKIEDAPTLFEYLTKTLLEPARNQGYDRHQGRTLNDFELLSALQHQEAATFFIDFTSNFHIALWFASQDDHKDGRVIVVNRGDISSFEEITPDRANAGLKEIFENHNLAKRPDLETEQKIYVWRPPLTENRVLVQNSYFIFSLQPIDHDSFVSLVVPKEDKRDIRSLLLKYYGIDNQSVFPDFVGFAKSQSQEKPLTIKSSKDWLREANAQFQRKEFELAVAAYSKVIELDPRNFDAFFSRAKSLTRLSKKNEALADYNTALGLNQNHADAYFERGRVRESLKCLEEAILDYGKAIELKPPYVVALFCRGLAKTHLGQYKSALDDLNETIRLNPPMAFIFLCRARVRWRLHDYQGAKDDCSVAIEMGSPWDADSYLVRGNAKFGLEDFRGADTDYTQVIELDPKTREAYTGRGYARTKLENYPEAVADFAEAIELDRDDIDSYLGRGLAYETLKSYSAARKDIEKALELALVREENELAGKIQKILEDRFSDCDISEK